MATVGWSDCDRTGTCETMHNSVTINPFIVKRPVLPTCIDTPPRTTRSLAVDWLNRQLWATSLTFHTAIFPFISRELFHAEKNAQGISFGVGRPTRRVNTISVDVITACPSYTAVNRRRSSFSDHRCSNLERSAAPCHVHTISVSLWHVAAWRPISSGVHSLDFIIMQCLWSDHFNSLLTALTDRLTNLFT